MSTNDTTPTDDVEAHGLKFGSPSDEERETPAGRWGLPTDDDVEAHGGRAYLPDDVTDDDVEGHSVHPDKLDGGAAPVGIDLRGMIDQQ